MRRVVEEGHGVISGEQIIEQNEGKRILSGGAAVGNTNKKTNIEVLDDERPIQQYYGQQNPNAEEEEEEYDSESGDLLKKLIENL